MWLNIQFGLIIYTQKVEAVRQSVKMADPTGCGRCMHKMAIEPQPAALIAIKLKESQAFSTGIPTLGLSLHSRMCALLADVANKRLGP